MHQETNESESLVSQQVSELQRFSKVAHVLKGIVAFLWLPGKKQRFDGPRSIGGNRDERLTRPIVVKMECAEHGGLLFSGSVVRPRNGKLAHQTIFKYEFTQPMTAEGRGEVLSSSKLVLARRAVGLLRSLARFGERKMFQPRAAQTAAPRHPMYLVPFPTGREVIDEAKLLSFTEGMQLGLIQAYAERLREDMCNRTLLRNTTLVNSAIVPDAEVRTSISRQNGFEDFSPVLGVPHWNPASALREMLNPAEDLMAQCGANGPDDFDQATLEKIVADFRAAVLLGERLTEEEIFDGLCNPTAPVHCAKGWEDIEDGRVVAAMRKACGSSRAAWEASNEDLLRAARHPKDPLILSKLSVTQIVTAESLQQLPEPYAGDFLPPFDWQPPVHTNATSRVA
jgi:hypothetical protein